MHQIRGLTDDELLLLEDRAEVAMRAALQQVMDTIVDRILAQVASGVTAGAHADRALWTGCRYCLNPRHPGPCAKPHGPESSSKRSRKGKNGGGGGGAGAGDEPQSGPGIGQDHIGDGDGTELAVAVDARAAETAYPSLRGGTYGPHGDEQAYAIAAHQGFDGKPKVVSRAEMDQLVAEGHTEMFRGVRGGYGTREGGDVTNPADDIEIPAAQIHERLRSGPVYYSDGGLYGSGIYVSPSRKKAADYAGDEPGALARMTLHKDARVRDADEFQAEHAAFVEGLQPGSPSYRIYSDPGRYAAARGYDALQVGKPTPTEVIVLNRTAMIIEEAQ